MRHAQRCAVMGIVMMWASVTGARELGLSVENRLGGDSNAFRTANASAEEPRAFYEISPVVEVREQHAELDYNFRYQPIYRTFLDEDRVDGVDHVQRALFDWQATPRDTLGFNQSFTDTRIVRLESQDLGDVVVVDESDRERIKRSRLDAYYSRVLNPRLSGRFGVEFDDVDFNSAFNIDSRAYGASLGGTRIMTEHLKMGLVAVGRFRDNRGVGPQRSSNAYIGNLALSLSYEFSPSASLSAQAGPTLIRSRLKGFTPSPLAVFFGATGDRQTETDLSFFASVDLEKRWQRGVTSISYNRSESGNAGNGTSIVDSVTAVLSHEPRLGLRLALYPRYSRQELVAESTIGGRGNERIESFSTTGLIEQRLTSRLRIRGEIRYSRVLQEQSFGSSGLEVISGFLSLQYVLEPWIF